MKKHIFTLFILFLFTLAFFFQSAKCENFYLSKDTIIPLYPVKILSTAVYDEGDFVYFIVPSDMWIDNYKIVPKNSIVKARITMLKMPVKGINACLMIDAIEISMPNYGNREIKGDITYKGEKQIGGTLTPPASYNKSLHPRRGEYYNGVIAQYVPSGEYEFGQHVTIQTNEMLQLVLTEDFIP